MLNLADRCKARVQNARARAGTEGAEADRQLLGEAVLWAIKAPKTHLRSYLRVCMLTHADYMLEMCFEEYTAKNLDPNVC